MPFNCVHECIFTSFSLYIHPPFLPPLSLPLPSLSLSLSLFHTHTLPFSSPPLSLSLSLPLPSFSLFPLPRVKYSQRNSLQQVFFPKSLEIHWLSIINSVVLVCLLLGFVMLILVSNSTYS